MQRDARRDVVEAAAPGDVAGGEVEDEERARVLKKGERRRGVDEEEGAELLRQDAPRRGAARFEVEERALFGGVREDVVALLVGKHLLKTEHSATSDAVLF